MGSVSVRYLFQQPMDEKIKTWTLRFPLKENPDREKALFGWPIVLQYDVKGKYRLIFRKCSSMKFFHLSVRVRWLNTVLAVREYMSFAKSWQEKGYSSQAETWQVKNILIKDFD